MVKFENVSGLTDKEVEESRAKNGSNYLPPPEVESVWDKLKDNFEDPLIRILLVALSITLGLAFLGYADWLEGFGIALAVFLAAFVSTYSEYKNESSFRDLQEKASKIQNTVFRNNIPVTVLSSDIVVGDYVLLQAGDKIPADGKLVFGELQVNQETLNGEAVPVSKVVAPHDYDAADKSDFLDRYLCFKGTVVDDGEGVMKVDTVGVETFYGKLHTELADNEDRESPLQVKLSDLADGVARFGYIGATAIAISFLFKQFVIDNKYNYEAILNYVSLGNWQAAFHDVVTSIILAIIVIVVAVPEGLPMMIAIVLSLNMRKLLKANVLVRKLLGIEAAGSINILFVDKTGTLTKGQFEPQMFLNGKGHSYARITNIPESLSKVLVFSIRESTSAVLGEKGVILGGNASDRALLSYITMENVKKSADTHLIKEILFNSARKFSASQLAIHNNKPEFIKGESITLVKGAPDLLLPNCQTCYHEDGSIGHLDISKLLHEINVVSKSGIRVIAIATSSESLEDHLPQQLTLVGVVGIKDEVRAESKGAIELANRAGIQVVMVTGDRKETAVAVAEELAMLHDNKEVLTSTQLKTMSDDELKAAIPRIAVISRALPTDKSRLVRVCQEMNQVVGMTGDGVNDSAALKKADVGFAMGSGSEVAKEASSIVILDDNFQSITQAVLYGRTIFKSIRKFIVFQSTVNCASMLIVFAGPFLGFDFPLTLIQLLWVNLVMDTLAALAFGGEPALKSYMHESPIRRDEKIITSNMWSSILTNGFFIASLCVIVLRSPSIRSLFTRDGIIREDVFLTSFFAFFIFLTALNAFNVRSPNTFNIFKHIFENRGFLTVMILIFAVQVTFTYVGGRFLRTVGLTPQEWMMIIGASAVIVPFDLVRKAVMKMLIPVKKNDVRVKEH